MYKFDVIDEKLKECKPLPVTDRFLVGQGISDGAKSVAALGEKNLYLYDSKEWKATPKE